MMNELLEVVNHLVEEGVQRKVAVNAVECVCRADVPYAANYRNARAFIDKDWEILAPLYTAICTRYLIDAGWIVQGMYFTRESRFCAYFVVIFKDDLYSGSTVYGVRRTVRSLNKGYGLCGCDLLQRL